MEIGSAIEWIVGMPMVVLALAIVMWWILGRKDKGLCIQCNTPKIFGDRCINCENNSVDHINNSQSSSSDHPV